MSRRQRTGSKLGHETSPGCSRRRLQNGEFGSRCGLPDSDRSNRPAATGLISLSQPPVKASEFSIYPANRVFQHNRPQTAGRAYRRRRKKPCGDLFADSHDSPSSAQVVSVVASIAFFSTSSDHTAALPPSAAITAPFTQLALLVARKTIVSAISLNSAARPSGIVVMMAPNPSILVLVRSPVVRLRVPELESRDLHCPRVCEATNRCRLSVRTQPRISGCAPARLRI
jgi:hypothetical protein